MKCDKKIENFCYATRSNQAWGLLLKVLEEEREGKEEE
jgi:hypothetical protein